MAGRVSARRIKLEKEAEGLERYALKALTRLDEIQDQLEKMDAEGK